MPIHIVQLNTFYGPNHYVKQRAIHLQLRLDDLSHELTLKQLLLPLSNTVPELFERLQGYNSQTLESDDSETIITFFLEQLLIISKHQPEFITLFKTDQADNFHILYSYEHARSATLAGQFCIELINYLLHIIYPDDLGTTIDFSPDTAFQALLQETRLLQDNPTHKAIREAARAQKIPLLEYDREPFVIEEEAPESLLDVMQLGYGSEQKIIKNTLRLPVSETIYPALKDRQRLYRALSEWGCPVALQDAQSSLINSARRAARSATRIGFPVTLKALCMSNKVDIFPALNNAEEVMAAYAQRQEQSRQVLIEQYIEGYLFELLIFQGQVYALRVPETETTPVTLYAADQLNNRLHPDILRYVQICAQHIKQSTFVMQICCTNIAQALAGQGGVISAIELEVDLSRFDTEQQSLMAKFAWAFIHNFFPEPEKSHIPIIAVTGTNGKTTTCRMLSHILQSAGFTTGLACTDGVYVNRDKVKYGTASGITGASNLFVRPRIEAAVIEISRGTLNEKGLLFSDYAVGVCCNVENDHIGLNGIESIEQMARVKQVVIENARQRVVLNADNPLCVDMARASIAEQICFTSLHSDNAVIKQHLASGNNTCAVFVESIAQQQYIVYAQGKQHTQLIKTDAIPATFNGQAHHNIDNALFACAAALGLNISTDIISTALSSFEASFENTPGRLNHFPGLPFTVVLDYAHNAHGLQALVQYSTRLQISGKRILVFVVPSDRRDIDFQESAEVVAGHFDYYVCRDTRKLRTMPLGEAPALLKKHLLQQGVSSDSIEVIACPEQACKKALQIANAGDLLMIASTSNAHESWELFSAYREQLNSNNC